MTVLKFLYRMSFMSKFSWHSFVGIPQKQHSTLLTVHVQCCANRFSHGQLFVTPWTIAHQAPLSMGFSRQECWSGLPCPSPGDLPGPGIGAKSLMSPALAGGFFTTSTTWEAPLIVHIISVRCLFVPLLLMSILVIRLRWYLPDFSTAMLPFSLLSLVSVLWCNTLRLCEYVVSHQTLTQSKFLFLAWNSYYSCGHQMWFSNSIFTSTFY